MSVARGLTRRGMLTTTLAAGLVNAVPFGRLAAQSDTIDERVEFRRLIAANRILANEGVVDAFGHASVRDPRDPERYVMSRSRSPELVEFADLMLFESDGTPVDRADRTPYGERMIHGAVYEAREDVNAVVHNHAYALLPFAITDVPLKPVVHTASVIGSEIPVWDIGERFGATDMLVRTMEQGRDLAATLGGNTCLLMRGHGAVVTGRTIQEAVVTSVYLQINADVQLRAMAIGEPNGLSPEEIELSRATQFSPLGLDRAWEYFCARAGVDPA
ncbi:class II aldolase/adducin family protein [Candidatus Rariloculus sp.]|uniref:class II aldolase/adducin family protein n=1 Tax=Candidatus Rariloculus sp. TaxID=3101265 RepID=UPI003D108F7F